MDNKYQEDLHINKNRLDEELMAQAHNMLQYSAAHAQAQYDRDRAKQHRDVVEAELDLEARNTPPPDGPPIGRGGEPTRDSITAWIKRNKKYQDALEAFNKAEFEVNLIFGAVMAMNARKGMLESLVRLYLSGYWSEPRVEGGETLKANGALVSTEDMIVRGMPRDVFIQEEPKKDAPRPVPTPIGKPALKRPPGK